MVDTHDDEDEDDDLPLRSAAAPEVDVDVDALAAALQSPRLISPGEGDLDDDELADGGGDLTDEADFEELDNLLEVSEDPTHPRRLYLVVDGRMHVVAQERFVIGRVSSQCDLAIIDANISRQHCAIERRDGLFFVVDLGSTNGIVVDGVRVDDHPIADGDVLVLSGHQVQCSFEPPELEVVAPAAAAAPTPSVTGRLAAVPIARAPEPEPEPEPEPAWAPEPATYEERMEQRLAAMSAQIAALTFAVQRLVEQGEAMKGVEALAQVIQRRFEQAKPR